MHRDEAKKRVRLFLVGRTTRAIKEPKCPLQGLRGQCMEGGERNAKSVFAEGPVTSPELSLGTCPLAARGRPDWTEVLSRKTLTQSMSEPERQESLKYLLRKHPRRGC